MSFYKLKASTLFTHKVILKQSVKYIDITFNSLYQNSYESNVYIQHGGCLFKQFERFQKLMTYRRFQLAILKIN